MKNFVQEGVTLSFANGATAAITSGQMIVFGDTVAVACTDIAKSTSGTVQMSGVFELPKEAPLVIAQGDKLYYNATGNILTKTNTDVFAGYAAEAAVSAATKVKILLAR